MNVLRASCLGLLALAWAGPLAAETVGVVAAVEPQAHVSGGSAGRKVLRIGADVLYHQRIETSASGSVQVLFSDRTTLNIGPNSAVTIDEFVFDRNRNVGHMTATLARGALRFVGGQTSHTGGATIRTPTTTLGVRGGIASVTHDAAAGTRVISHFGSVVASTAQGRQVLDRSGLALTVAAAGQAAALPAMASRAEFDAALPGAGNRAPGAARGAGGGKGRGKGGGGGGGGGSGGGGPGAALGGGPAAGAGAAARSGAQQSMTSAIKSYTPPGSGSGGGSNGGGNSGGGNSGGGNNGGGNNGGGNNGGGNNGGGNNWWHTVPRR